MSRTESKAGDEDCRSGTYAALSSLDDGTLVALLQQMRSAVSRAQSLCTQTSEPQRQDVVLAVVQELDSAHEELRVAEEHVQSQADIIAQTRGALDVERGRYRELFEVAPDPYLLTDIHGNVLQANRRARELLRIEASFLLGKPLAAFVDAEDRRHFLAVLDVLLRDRTASSFELRLQPRQSFTPVWVAVSACRTLGANGAQVHWLLRDVTAIKDSQRRERDQSAAFERKLGERTQELQTTKHLLEHSLAREQRARAQLATVTRKHQQLFASIAHELRNSLSAVSGWLQILQMGVEGEAMARAQASMTRNVRALTRMVQDLVDHGGTDQGPFYLERTTVQVPAVMAQALEDCRPVAAQNNVQLIADIAKTVPPVDADPQRLLQVLNNLLGTALKFTPKDGAITLSLKALGRALEISICDVGSLIDSTFLPRMFDAFPQPRQKGTAAEHTGWELGLHLSRWLIELHGGSIRAESVAAKGGARFVIRLPIES